MAARPKRLDGNCRTVWCGIRLAVARMCRRRAWREMNRPVSHAACIRGVHTWRQPT